ncbi:type II and III secretion system protein family protein [Dyella amyloliquefaciens]|uniref:type II and III secretion system protein family protein n=1 Tax=Dyella amyloliquefaciens TaxID=1770545 RepID=UPI001E335439|nr:type II and III secretion system protein family protein [Dyella amyloliquefaciens]
MDLKYVTSCLFLALAALATAPEAAASAGEALLSLQVHEQRPWRLAPDMERVAIADPAVVDLVMLKGQREALLVGKRAGQTTLQLWHRGDATPQRWTVEVESEAQASLQADGHLKVSAGDGEARILGHADSMAEHDRAVAVAQGVVGEKGSVIDSSTVADGGVVQVDVKVVEFDKSVMSQLGLNFKATNQGFSYGFISPLGSGASDSSGGALSSAFNLVFSHTSADGAHSWSSNINLLQSNGMARVLAEPTLVALSGQSASFLSGGELPIPEPQGLGTTTIAYKSFGIGLTLTPTVLAPDRIALKVAPEASDLDYANAVTLNGVSVPAIATRRADTTVELGDGETFVIGGLVSSSISSQVDKIPLLGDIPVLGAFFRDLRYSRQDKELVLVVTPHLVKPIAKGVTLPLPGESEQRNNLPVWGSWLLHPAGGDQLPGFSR